MSFVLDGSKLLNTLWERPSKYFLEKLWVIRPRRLVFLFIIAFFCLSAFFGYRLLSRNYIVNGYAVPSKIKSAVEELKGWK
jgi:hypothetical protein